jgi:tRNA-dihydrouridine synthase
MAILENNFWQNLPKHFTVLAPMEDVTDTVFRQVICATGRPDVFFTEFTNCEGMQSVGQSKVIHRLKFDPKIERPIVAQVWGITPEDYQKTARLIVDLGFDGLDINMGCPVKNVIKQGACSALIKNPTLAKEIVLATREGLQNKIPLSIKTRIGFGKIDTENWIGFLLGGCRPEALTIHARTVAEQSSVPNHWEEIAKIRDLQQDIQKDLPKNQQSILIVNGDIRSLVMAKRKMELHNFDGAMIGRGVFQNPWIFNPNFGENESGEIIDLQTQKIVDLAQRIEVLKIHLGLWEKIWGTQKPYSVLKKYFKIYISGFNGASKIRAKMMETNSIEEVRGLLTEINLFS